MARSPDAPCPCGSRRKFKRCCLRLHRGARALSPEALMRSRWSAYSVGNVDYIIATTDPQGPQWEADESRWRAQIRAFSQQTRFERLEIRARSRVEQGKGEVTFHATLSRAGEDTSFTERSSFVERGGRWLYHSGDPADVPAPLPEPGTRARDASESERGE